ncbi:unnamed protein product [Arabis nemorensis]|uniref:U1-type domain-containing protein n=1 Tax=Arabis nemorensis TaxID=586526 RepID=A0A565C5H2_9BRAS|nr:unnamed protein product [Arabis nemorensis]
MEFRYRAVDGDRPSTATDTAPSQPPNTTFSFFPSRPMLGPSEDHVREAIQREIEKEQIRQEIIVAGTSRRRELIAEVLQEMAVEREMAIRRVIRPYSLVTSPMTQMPKATPPVLESNKDKLIVLNRADSVGEKRKAEDTQTGIGRAKRIAREDWSFRILKEHLQEEKMQKEKEAASKAKPISVETGETVSLNLPCLEKLSSGKQQVESKPKFQFKFWCDVCSVGSFTQTIMKDHELGKKHIAAIKKQNELLESASTSIITAPASATSPQSEAIIKVLQNANVEDQKETGKKTEGEKEKKVIIRCETCKIWTHSEQVMETHKLGKKHKALLEKQQHKPLAVLDTNVMTVPVRSLNADPGEKGSVDHTKGMVHCLD